MGEVALPSVRRKAPRPVVPGAASLYDQPSVSWRWYPPGMPENPLRVELEREEDGRWLAEVVGLPGVLAYGTSRADALAKVEVLALRVIADRLEHGERVPALNNLFAAA